MSNANSNKNRDDKPADELDLQIHLDGLLVGLIVFPLFFGLKLFLPLSWGWGWIGVVVCVIMEEGQITQRFGHPKRFISYFLVSIAQAVILWGIFVVLWFAIFGNDKPPFPPKKAKGAVSHDILDLSARVL